MATDSIVELNGDDGPQRVITVRLPARLHEALLGESDRHNASLNQLCVSKLLRPADGVVEYAGFHAGYKRRSAIQAQKRAVRVEAMQAMKRSGMTHEQIAEQHGISKQRVQQILATATP